MKTTRRSFLQTTMAAAAAAGLPWHVYMKKAYGAALINGLSDPMLQPKFATPVKNALDPDFIFQPTGRRTKSYTVGVDQAIQMTGLRVFDPNNGQDLGPAMTTVWGYGVGRGQFNYGWPGMTFEVTSREPIAVTWENRLDRLPHPVTSLGRSVIDTTLHWAYSLPGYTQYSVDRDGVPIVPHVHGGHNDFQYDGNPEFFFSPNWQIRGPQWRDRTYVYDNSQPAGTVWYHDHALGITRLNVYAGMAGFFIIRDNDDTGRFGNPLDLPAHPYEAAFAIQDKMFDANGGLFYPAYLGDPFYDDFITGENADWAGTNPTALAEFFGDHMLVNGAIWPFMEVEPRNYRLRLLNGCDSRFLAVQFFEVPPSATDFSAVVQQLDFTVIGSDQGLASSPTKLDTLLMETGSRYDIIFDFKNVTPGNRVIMKNIGGDEPFGGDIGVPPVFDCTDRIMAFDVTLPLDTNVPDVSPTGINFGPNVPGTPTRTRKVALFEGKDEFGRLQPLLGTAEPATDYAGNPVNWPDTQVYSSVGLTGQMEGSIAWHSPTTENPALDSTEEWEVWNVTGDAHPVHLHLVHFEILGRQEIVWDSATNEDDRVLDPTGATAPVPNGDGTYLVAQPTVQHNSVAGDPLTYGMGFRIVNRTYGPAVPKPAEYVENAPKDMVTALPGQITRIKATFDKPGRYVWHCHILSHEDHEMMRVLEVTEPGVPIEEPTPVTPTRDRGGSGRGRRR